MGNRTCSIETCDERHEARGYCAYHYKRLQRWGDPLGSPPERPAKGLCTAKDCDRQITNHKDLCDRCHSKRRRAERRKVRCAWPECTTGRATGDYCLKHWRQMRSLVIGPCSIDDCEEAVAARGWCDMHYSRWQTHGDPLFTLPRIPPVIRKYALNEAFFDEITTERQAYWLGLITADGNVMNSGGHYVMKISLEQSDGGLLERMCADMGSSTPVRVDSRGQAYVGLGSRRLVEALGALGVTPCKSATVEPWDGPADLMPHYWRGLFDGDGCIGRYKKGKRGHVAGWALTQAGSLACVTAFADWARAICGTKAKVQHVKSCCWHIAVGGSWAPQKLATALYADATVAMPRKLALAEELMASDFAAMYGNRTHSRY